MRKNIVYVAVLALVVVLGATAVLVRADAAPPEYEVRASTVFAQEPDEPESPDEVEAPQDAPLYRRGMGPMWGGGTALDIVAEELGLTVDELLAELRDGATIADLAEEAGTTIEAIVEALSEAHAEALQAAVEAGRISAEDAALMQERMVEMWARRLESGRLFGWRGRGMGRQMNPDCPMYDGDGAFVPGQGMGRGGGRGPGMGQSRGFGGGNGSGRSNG